MVNCSYTKEKMHMWLIAGIFYCRDTLTKQGKERASAYVGLMFTAYNLRRIMNILGQEVFKKYLRMLVLLFLQIFGVIRFKVLQFKKGKILHKYSQINFVSSLNRLIFG